jgi:hypothetical protein
MRMQNPFETSFPTLGYGRRSWRRFFLPCATCIVPLGYDPCSLVFVVVGNIAVP